MRQAADQRGHPRHLLRPRLSRPERPARSVLEPGRNPHAPYRVVADSAAPVGAGEGLAGVSTAAGSTRNDTLIAGCGRVGIEAVDGSRTAQTTAMMTHRRDEPPTGTQRR